MRHNITLVALALMGLTIFFSCKKSSSGTTAYCMTATVNGVAFNAKNCLFLPSNTGGAPYDIYGGNFTGNIPQFPFILLSFGSYPTIGTHTLGNITIANGWVDSSNTVQPVSIHGTVEITADSPEVVGTFSFVCTDSTTVTSGSFKARKL